MSTIGVGTVIARRYRLERPIGEGGMGEVYAAHDTQRGHGVALKLLRAEHATDPKVIGRFVREARVAKQINSPNVAAVHDFGVCEGTKSPFIVFELLEGEDLAHVLASQGPLPQSTAVDYVMQALAGIAAAHVQGVAHRDLKPANLFRVTAPGGSVTIKVLDFGIAKALKGRELGQGPQTETAALLGSPLYMSPEQLRSSRRIDARADVWSMGVTLYELLTGSPPFDGKTLGQFLSAVMEGAPVPLEQRRPDAPPALAAIVLKCLQKKREDRFDSVKDLAAALVPFGTAVSDEALERIVETFESQTAQRPAFWSDSDIASAPASDPFLGAGAASNAPSAAVPSAAVSPSATTASGKTSTQGNPSRSSTPLAVVGLLLLLLAAGAVGFFLTAR